MKRLHILLRVMVLLVVSIQLNAAEEEITIYRCKDSRDRLALSDRPCGPDQELIDTQTVKIEKSKPVKATPVNSDKKANSTPEIAKENEACEEKKRDGPWLKTFDSDC